MGDLEKVVFQTECYLLESDSSALTGKENKAPALFKLGLWVLPETFPLASMHFEEKKPRRN